MLAADLKTLTGKLVIDTPTAGQAKFAADCEAILVTKADDKATTLKVWYLKNDNTAAFDEGKDIVVLLGTVTGDGETAITLDAATFSAS